MRSMDCTDSMKTRERHRRRSWPFDGSVCCRRSAAPFTRSPTVNALLRSGATFASLPLQDWNDGNVPELWIEAFVSSSYYGAYCHKNVLIWIGYLVLIWLQMTCAQSMPSTLACCCKSCTIRGDEGRAHRIDGGDGCQCKLKGWPGLSLTNI